MTDLPLAEPDLRIARIALSHELTLVTVSLGHVPRVPGLSVEKLMAVNLAGTLGSVQRWQAQLVDDLH